MHSPKPLQEEAKSYLNKYRKNRDSISSSELWQILNLSLDLFFIYYELTGAPLREVVELICEVNASHNLEHAQLGIESLFPNLIEKLNDAFSPKNAHLYDRIITQVISQVRQQPEGQSIDIALKEIGFSTEASILSRKHKLFKNSPQINASQPLKSIFFLSRVTIGADIAITSVLINHLMHQFPSAQIFLLGSTKLSELFGGDPRIHILPIKYGRGGKLHSRIETWLDVLATLRRETKSLSPTEFLVIDPDSRLTQLGVLPILPSTTERSSYIFFPSRSYSAPGINKLGQLAARWISNICPLRTESYPFISLTTEQISFGQRLVSQLQTSNNRPIFTISFGVGGNLRKRVSQEFEVKLVQQLAQSGNIVIDCGSTESEYEQILPISDGLGSVGKKAVTLHQSDFSSYPTVIGNADAIFWRGSLGSLASIISASDLYIGYDSAGQHLAAALNVPTLTIFVNSGTNLFPLRWQPHGKGPIETLNLPANFLQLPEYTLSNILDRIHSLQAKLLAS